MNSVAKLSGEQLEDAFQLFNQMSEKLALSYGELDGRVAQLSAELAEARSERLKQLAEKERLASRLEGLLNTLPAAIIVLDKHGCINQVNAIAQKMLGDDLLGSLWSELAQQKIITVGDEFKLHNGCWISLSTRKLDAEPGKIILITDISETRHLQSMLNRKQRLTSLGEMLSSLAHQVRTPLSSALLYLSNVSHPSAQKADRIRYTEKSRECLHHLNRMVNDMLMFAKGSDSTMESIELSAFISQLQALLEPQLLEAGASLHIDNRVASAELPANRDALLGAFQNLTNNAIEACESAGVSKPELNLLIELTADKRLALSFSDNGCGIENDIKERILEPFFTTRSSGTGLGLAVVNATINSLSGTLEILSEAGAGSCFKIQLPLVNENTILPSELNAWSDMPASTKCAKNEISYFHQMNEANL